MKRPETQMTGVPAPDHRVGGGSMSGPPTALEHDVTGHEHEWVENWDWNGGPSEYPVRQCVQCNEIRPLPIVDGCQIVDRRDGHYVCYIHFRYWRIGSGICPGRNA